MAVRRPKRAASKKRNPSRKRTRRSAKKRNPTYLANGSGGRKRRAKAAKRKARNPSRRPAAVRRKSAKRRRNPSVGTGDLQALLIPAAIGAAVAVGIGAVVSAIPQVAKWAAANPKAGAALPGAAAAIAGFGLAFGPLKNSKHKKIALATGIAGAAFAVKAVSEKAITEQVQKLMPAPGASGYESLASFGHSLSGYAEIGANGSFGYSLDSGQGGRVFAGY